MDAVKVFIFTYWPNIVEYALMLVAYFLVFLYRNKVNSTKENINLAFTQFSDKLTTGETRAQEQLAASKKAYADAVESVKKMSKKVSRLEAIMKVMFSNMAEKDILIEEVHAVEDILAEDAEVETEAEVEVEVENMSEVKDDL